MAKKINYVRGKSGRKLPVYMLAEPFKEEILRIRFEELSEAGRDFAYTLESIPRSIRSQKHLAAKTYRPYVYQENAFYNRYAPPKSASIGLLLTNIDLSRLDRNATGQPSFWQMGPERRKLALAQRAHFFDDNQNNAIHKLLNAMEKGKVAIAPRPNKRSPTIEHALGMAGPGFQATKTPAIQELGYKKISTDKIISRREILKTGLVNFVGKHPRKVIGLGAMPPVSGWRDTLVMSAVGHMLCFIPRSSIYAGNIQMRFDLGTSALTTIDKLHIDDVWKTRAKRNIGVALGAENPQFESDLAKKFQKELGINVFRIYTIGSDNRVIETAALLRKKLGKAAEIFVGQIADKKQAERLIARDIAVDGLIFGHGGGQQCTSAINGMAITTLEDLYAITLDKKFNKTSLILEGGVGRSIGIALIIGADACLGNQKFVAGTIETGGLFVLSDKGKICQPYPGTASPVTQIIESENADLRKRRSDAAGRTYYSEGKPGLMFYEAKAGSMAFRLTDYLSHAARTLADFGVNNLGELRSFLTKANTDYLRVLSEETKYLSEAHWNLVKGNHL